MATLIMHFDAPLQSWGLNGRFTQRDTHLAPTKSGVVGLLAAALGRTREEEIDDLAELAFGARVDQLGPILRDFQTEQTLQGRKKPLTTRYYLQDSKFVVGVEGETDRLSSLAEAVRNPRFPLYLGRRSCPPAGPIQAKVVEAPLEQALKERPWIASESVRKRQPTSVSLQIYRDAYAEETADELLRDLPLSFSQRHRRYALRPIVHTFVTIDNPDGRTPAPTPEQHDPFQLLEGA